MQRWKHLLYIYFSKNFKKKLTEKEKKKKKKKKQRKNSDYTT